MKWRIVVVGKPSLKFAALGAEEYLNRLRRHGSVELVVLRDAKPAVLEERFLAASENCWRLALDPRGELIDTQEIADLVEKREREGAKRAAVWIGGADGLGDRLRGRADATVALGRITLQHELALVVWLEQLYRVGTLRRGEPYHR